MQEQKFEEQVRQKMEELSLVPSEPVWKKVEEQIRKKKDRRFIYYLIPLCLLTTGIILWQSDKNHNVYPTSKQPSARDKSFVLPPHVPKNEKEEKREIISLNTKPSQTTKRIVAEKKPISKRDKITYYKEKNKYPQKLIKEKTTSVNASENKTLKDQSTALPSQESLTVEQRNNVIIEKTIEQNLTAPTVKEKNNNISSVNTQAPLHVNIHDNLTMPKTKNGTNKWKRVITLQAGYSDYKEGLFSNNNADRYYASPSNTPITGVFFPNKTTKGFSFVIGGGIQKRFVNQRIQLSALIQYHFYSTNVKVGQERRNNIAASYGSDSLRVTKYYSNGTATNYTNKFSMVELPIAVSYQPLKRIPITFSAGAAYGYLIESNALTFDRNINIYYYNKRNNINNYVSIFSSLQYLFPSKTKIKISTGPAIQFLPSEIQRDNSYTIPHLFYIGLKTDINF